MRDGFKLPSVEEMLKTMRELPAPPPRKAIAVRDMAVFNGLPVGSEKLHAAISGIRIYVSPKVPPDEVWLDDEDKIRKAIDDGTERARDEGSTGVGGPPEGETPPAGGASEDGG